MFTQKKSTALWNEALKRIPGRDRWATGLLMISSAALGGIAVALWNRRVLNQIQEAGDQPDVTTEQMEFFEYE